MLWDYANNVLTIKNKKSKLTPKSLLLGASSKEGKEDLIGEHGEGYKVATVVLERNGVKVRIYNNEAKEVWDSKVVNSRRYGEDVVVFDIEKKIFQNDCDLVIELDGITPEMYDEIVKSNLHLQGDVGKTKESQEGYGRILLDSRYKGEIYVEGLYVCTKESLEWGYDFAANMVKLDRDRGLIDSFDLLFTVAKLVRSLGDERFISENIRLYDLTYIASYMYKGSDLAIKTSNNVYENFKQEYGEDAIPTSTSAEFNRYVDMGAKPIMVDRQVKEVINIVERDFTKGIKLSDVDREFQEWLTKVEQFLPQYLAEEILGIWKRKGGYHDADEKVQAE